MDGESKQQRSDEMKHLEVMSTISRRNFEHLGHGMRNKINIAYENVLFKKKAVKNLRT